MAPRSHHETTILTLLQRFYVAAGQSNSNSVNCHLWFHGRLSGIFKGLSKRKTLKILKACQFQGDHRYQTFPGYSTISGAPRLLSLVYSPPPLIPARVLRRERHRDRVPPRPQPRGAAPRLTMAAARLPDRLVPPRERTAVSQEQQRAERNTTEAATASSSKRR